MSIIEKIKNKEVTVGDLVKGKIAVFEYYRAGNLYYITDDAFQFPVPISDTGEGEFRKGHKAIELMRWIKKQFDIIQREA